MAGGVLCVSEPVPWSLRAEMDVQNEEKPCRIIELPWPWIAV